MPGSDVRQGSRCPVSARVLPPISLADIVGDPGPFLASLWGAQAGKFHCPAVLHLLCVAEIWELLDCGSLVAPYFGIRRDDAGLTIAGVTQTRIVQTRPMSMYADPEAIRAKVGAGSTLALNQPEHWQAPIKELLAGLRGDLSAELRSSAFLSPSGASLLPVHSDAAHLFLVQLHGRIDWVVGEDGENTKLSLWPGDVLYVPAGHRHGEESRHGESLHLAITVQQPTTRELAELALANFLSSARARDIAGTHHLMSPDEKVDWLRVELADFLQGYDVDALLAEAVADRQRRGVA